MKKKIIVIGSGFGGLAAAARLLIQGHEVDIYEKRDKLGGRAYVYEQDGFKFDGGPTIITAPYLFDEIFEAAGKNREDYFTFVKNDPFYRIFDHNKRVFNYNDDEMFILNEIDKVNPADKRGYLNFVHKTKDIFEKAFDLIDTPFDTWGSMIKAAPDLISLRADKGVYKSVSNFIEDEFLRQVFSFHPLLIGGNPFDASAIYAMIHYLEREWGVYYTMGGTASAINGFAKLIEELGGNIHLNTEVDEIIVNNLYNKNYAAGVKLKDGTTVFANEVVCNADVAWTYSNLIPTEHRKKYTDQKLDKMRYSMSLFVIYFGTKKQYRDQGLGHHNIILGPRYKGLLDDIFKNKILSDDFSLYLHMPTLTDPSMAPEGCESFYVLSPVPHLDSDTDWRTEAKVYRDKIMNFLEENYLPDLQENIISEHYIDPLHFQNELNSYKGAFASVEPILTQSAFLRPHNKSEEMDHLYFVGAGTHPGAGLPGVISSAKIAAKLIGSA